MLRLLTLFACLFNLMFADVRVGLEVLLERGLIKEWRGRRAALLTHAAAVDRFLRPSAEVLSDSRWGLKLKVIFGPEHGLDGAAYANERVAHKQYRGIPVISLFGDNRRPSEAMLRDVEVLFVDLQEIGLRWYTYASTLFYCMEMAAKLGIEVVVLDRPNPMGGLIMDGPMLDTSLRSFVGYVNVPACHGMTIAELARLFNKEYHINCKLRVIAMEGWERKMVFSQTGLPWVLPSPNMPEADTPMYSAITGPLGELGIVSVGIGYTLPFKLIGAPWLDHEKLAQRITALKIPGLRARPLLFKPHYGKFHGQVCKGIQLFIHDHKALQPLHASFTIMALLLELHPQEVQQAIKSSSNSQKEMFAKVLGTRSVLQALEQPQLPLTKLVNLHKNQRRDFQEIRKPYLLPQYR